METDLPSISKRCTFPRCRRRKATIVAPTAVHAVGLAATATMTSDTTERAAPSGTRKPCAAKCSRKSSDSASVS